MSLAIAASMSVVVTSALSPVLDIDNARLASRANDAPNNILIAVVDFLVLCVCSTTRKYLD
jgi:hypothetical protein